MTRTLEPIAPSEALEMYLQDIDGDLSPNSVDQKRYQLGFFIKYCQGEEDEDTRIENAQASSEDDAGNADSGARVSNLNEITGRDFTKFKNWRGDGLNKVTLRTNLSAVREFMRFCVSIDAVPQGTPDKINVPDLEHGENQREEFMDAEEANAIRSYLETFEYAGFNHILFELQWLTGMRMSGLHSLDVNDFDYDNQQLSVKHRPDQGTRLKNGPDGERIVTINEPMADAIQDFIDYQRHTVEDDYGRRPLFSSEYGRMSKMNLNKRIYQVSTPCYHGLECPAGKQPEDCEYTWAISRMLKCPHNTRPHDVRRGSITNWLKNDAPEKVVSDRMNVSVKTLDRHYDKRTEAEKADQRRQYLEDVE